MARCGCQAAASTTCEAIVLCVAANLGPGLMFNSGTGNIQVRLSGDSGNVVSFGTDQGIYVPGEDVGPGPGPGRATIEGLPDQVISGAWGGALAQAPNGSPYSIDFCVSQRVDMINSPVFEGTDGVSQWAVTTPGQSVFSRTDNPNTGTTWWSTDANSLLGFNVDAGTRDSPTGRNSGAPSDMLSPDGGWYGFWAHQYKPMTTTEALTHVAARCVVSLELQRTGTLAESEARINAAIESIIAAAAQEWCMISVRGYFAGGDRPPIEEWADVITAAGITPSYGGWDDAEMSDPFTGEEIAAAGYEWVRYSWDGLVSTYETEAGAIARIQELIDAELNVQLVTPSRQYLVEEMFDLGVRVVESHDPVYSRGGRGEAGDFDYRTTGIPALQFRTTGIGMNTRLTDGTFNHTARGFGRANITGRWFPPGFGWDNDDVGLWRNNQLLGQICPIPNTTNYSIAMRVRYAPPQPPGQQPKLAIAFGFETDQDISYRIGFSPPDHAVGYSARIVVGALNTARMEIMRYDPETQILVQEDPDELEFPTNMWTEIRVTVEGPTITFSAENETGSHEITADDSNYRGEYAFYLFEDQGTAVNPDAAFLHAYQNPDGMQMYTDLL